MTGSERKALATKAAHARWKRQKLPEATHEGAWKLGKVSIECCVLEDGKRVFSERGLSVGLTHVRSGGEFKKRKGLVESGKPELPVFMSDKIAAMLPAKTRNALGKPLHFRSGGGLPRRGIEAEHLADICEAFLEARDNGLLRSEPELRKAAAAEKILRGLAKLGAVALIDEVTGYQYERDRGELQRLLEKYVSEEFRPWSRKFPAEFYRVIFQLKGIKMADVKRRPQWMGHITNNLIYDRMLPNLRASLAELNPTDEKGNRSHRHHQHLTPETGSPHLDEQIRTIITLGKASIARNDSWNVFMGVVDKVSPKKELVETEGEADDD